MHEPSWFKDGEVLISFAPTVGINKDGEELYMVDVKTGTRTEEVNDKLAEDVSTVLDGRNSETIRWVPEMEVFESGIAVPTYFDERTLDAYRESVGKSLPKFSSSSLGRLIDSSELIVRFGHGSPSADLRDGDIPYIKVSDLRAGQVNINPTNRVSRVVAEKHWRNDTSGLEDFDLITPSRTSKNIGEIAVLMPGQKEVVLTKEILVIRPGPMAEFDSFYLLWALSLSVVRAQWSRIVFMQTNREDSGRRFREIEIPVAADPKEATRVSQPFRDYYMGMAVIREKFVDYLAEEGQHHVFLGDHEALS